MKKRNDLTGCKVVFGASKLCYDVIILDEKGQFMAGISIPEISNTSAKFKKSIRDALRSAAQGDT